MNSQDQKNSGYSFEGTEAFTWHGRQLGEQRYHKMIDSFTTLKDLCVTRNGEEDPEDIMLLETMQDVLESLERTFVLHFRTKTGHVFSPKSDEPWD